MSNYIVDTEYGDERANVGHDGAKGAAVAEGLSGELPGSESKGRLWGSECKRLVRRYGRSCVPFGAGVMRLMRGRQVSVGGTGGCQWVSTAAACVWCTQRFGVASVSHGTVGAGAAGLAATVL